ncbi:putative selenocysteine insertion sequence-binding protein 2 [Paratrimastix pyriformis]|uniref:Selenocysteine insertion sequence-binding protein 2 n=1 Tax=Paratrimastix pyriformis TaxID=342808 RepID=A0ABQ8UJ15_9EUKA|nr:putative selenocysteine insertion sequence-binding protein 2 [Paratrimastix pyriformis]
MVHHSLEERVAQLLGKLYGFQQRAMLNPHKGKRKRRLVFGLNEVLRGLRVEKAKCLVIPTNLDCIGGLNEFLGEILRLAAQQHIPVVYAMTRAQLSRLFKRGRRIGAVAIYDMSGADAEYRTIIAMAEQAVGERDDGIFSILRVNRLCPSFYRERAMGHADKPTHPPIFLPPAHTPHQQASEQWAMRQHDPHASILTFAGRARQPPPTATATSTAQATTKPTASAAAVADRPPARTPEEKRAHAKAMRKAYLQRRKAAKRAAAEAEAAMMVDSDAVLGRVDDVSPQETTVHEADSAPQPQPQPPPPIPIPVGHAGCSLAVGPSSHFPLRDGVRSGWDTAHLT